MMSSRSPPPPAFVVGDLIGVTAEPAQDERLVAVTDSLLVVAGAACD
jgi:hypothetical protein